MAINSHLDENESRIVITTPAYATINVAGAANVAAVQALIDLISLESAATTDNQRYFLDEMSPACRDVLYAHLTALIATIVDV